MITKQLALAGVALVTYVMGSGSLAHAQDAHALDEMARISGQLDQEYQVDGQFRQQVDKGVKISPVPVDTANPNAVLIGLGSYLVNAVGGCNDCHTNPSWAPGGNPYLGQPKQVNVAGYLAGGQQFPPGVVSRNLTPENGLPGGRTFAQFKLIMRTGIDLDNATPQFGPLLQVMPWPDYQSMTDRDLLAIYAYLSVIPSLTPQH